MLTASVKSFHAWILCKRHNVAFSPLDAMAGRLFRAFRRFDAALQQGAIDYDIVSLNGCDLERWLLKVLLGALAAGTLKANGVAVKHDIPLELLRLLVDESDWSPGSGLYVDKMRIGQATEFQMAPLMSQNRVAGGRFSVAGVPMILRWGGTGDLLVPPAKATHRPGAIVFSRGRDRCDTLLGWPPPYGTNIHTWEFSHSEAASFPREIPPI